MEAADQGSSKKAKKSKAKPKAKKPKAKDKPKKVSMPTSTISVVSNGVFHPIEVTNDSETVIILPGVFLDYRFRFKFMGTDLDGEIPKAWECVVSNESILHQRALI